jgi:hypothetical protein
MSNESGLEERVAQAALGHKFQSLKLRLIRRYLKAARGSSGCQIVPVAGLRGLNDACPRGNHRRRRTRNRAD